MTDRPAFLFVAVMTGLLAMAAGLDIIDSESQPSRTMGWVLVLGCLLVAFATLASKRAWVAVAVVVIVAVPVVAQAYLRSEVHQWAWQSVPERLAACGRTYSETALPETHRLTRTALTTGSKLSHTLWTARGLREVWVAPNCASAYLRMADDRFVGYGLSGGL